MRKPNIFEFENLQEAWEGLNEYMINNEEKICAGNGANLGSELGSYDNIVYSNSHRIDRKFNFGKSLGYTDKKWTKLIKNYLNYDYLDLVATEIQRREKSNKPHYNYTLHFDNKYGSGKDCLISITFSRRRIEDDPVLIFKTRASEITKRLLFDFLLVQRIGEYVYGKKQNCQVIAQIDFMFIVTECCLMYVAYRGREIVKKQEKSIGNKGSATFYTKFQEKMLKRYQFFLDTPLEKITFQVHKRAAAQVKRHPETGGPLANCKDLFAKQLKLHSDIKLKEKDIEKLNTK